jgi:hypothetical protein
MINIDYTPEEMASLRSDTWKIRLSLVKKDFVKLNETLKINVEKMVEDMGVDDEITEDEKTKVEEVENLMKDIFLIQDFIDEMNDIIEKVGKYPLSINHVERISYFEKEYYSCIMIPEIYEILSEEIRLEERLNNILEEIFNNINEMWDNNETEENMKKYLFDTLKTIYSFYPTSQLLHSANLMYISLTSQKPVRVNLSDEQIANLKRTKGLIGTCGNCLDNYNENEEVISFNCQHNFHPECIIPWLKRSVKCPNCRCDLRE